MKVYDVWYCRNHDMFIYAVLAENGDEALETVRKATGDDTICAFNRGDDDCPTVGEVFELIEQIKQSEKDPHAGIRQQARNFRRALNNWLETGIFGTKVLKPGLYYRALPGKNFSLCQIPPEAAETWSRLKDAVK